MQGFVDAATELALDGHGDFGVGEAGDEEEGEGPAAGDGVGVGEAVGGDEDIFFVFEKAEESAKAGAAAFVACGSDGGIRDGFNTAFDEGRHRFFARRSVGTVAWRWKTLWHRFG